MDGFALVIGYGLMKTVFCCEFFVTLMKALLIAAQLRG
jgi:hypothetical protein